MADQARLRAIAQAQAILWLLNLFRLFPMMRGGASARLRNREEPVMPTQPQVKEFSVERQLRKRRFQRLDGVSNADLLTVIEDHRGQLAGLTGALSSQVLGWIEPIDTHGRKR